MPPSKLQGMGGNVLVADQIARYLLLDSFYDVTPVDRKLICLCFRVSRWPQYVIPAKQHCNMDKIPQLVQPSSHTCQN